MFRTVSCNVYFNVTFGLVGTCPEINGGWMLTGFVKMPPPGSPSDALDVVIVGFGPIWDRVIGNGLTGNWCFP